MIINLGNNATDKATPKVKLFYRISSAFLAAYDSDIPDTSLPTVFLEDGEVFVEFQYWLSSKHNVSCRLFDVGKEESDNFLYGVEFTEDENFTKLLLQLPEVTYEI